MSPLRARRPGCGLAATKRLNLVAVAVAVAAVSLMLQGFHAIRYRLVVVATVRVAALMLAVGSVRSLLIVYWM